MRVINEPLHFAARWPFGTAGAFASLGIPASQGREAGREREREREGERERESLLLQSNVKVGSARLDRRLKNPALVPTVENG